MIVQPSAHPFAWTSQPWGRALRSPAFARIASHLFTTRDLALRGPGAEGGWAQLARAVGVGPDHLARLKQVHGVEVVVIRAGESRRQSGKIAASGAFARPASDSDEGWPRADIVMTDDPAVAVAVQVADCVPLLLADPVTGAVAAVHGGWRGTAAGIARVAVSAMTTHFGARPADLLAAIGPSIGACCYQVGPDVARAFRAAGFSDDNLRAWFRPDEPHVAHGPGPLTARYRLDVPMATIDQLHAAGLEAANIASCGLCTACHPSPFPSYRRDGAGTGRIAGVIRPGP